MYSTRSSLNCGIRKSCLNSAESEKMTNCHSMNWSDGFSHSWRKLNSGGKSMTVCIAAIAAKSKAIVMIADKAITYGLERPMQADVGIKKILPVGKTGWHALVGGDPSFAKEVIDTALEKIVNADGRSLHLPGRARTMMHCIKDAYKDVRKQLVTDGVLAPSLLDEMKLQSLPDDYAIAIYGALADFKVNCSLLVCGFDLDKVPHIFSVVSPGIATIPGDTTEKICGTLSRSKPHTSKEQLTLKSANAPYMAIA